MAAVFLYCTMIVLLGTAQVTPVAQSAPAGTIYVACAPGEGVHNTLTGAAAAAQPGDTIVVQGKCYPEVLDIDKALNLTASAGPVVVGECSVGSTEVCIPLRVVPCFLNTQCVCNPPGDCSEGRPVGWICPQGGCGMVNGNPALKAKVYYPSTVPGVGTPIACGGPFPAVVYIHGYRKSSLPDWGMCTNWSDPGPTHEDYLQAEGILRRIAASGMIAVSLDASCGICGKPRGAFALNALAYLSDKNIDPGSFLKDNVDLTRIGLVGHSCGGAGVIYAAKMVHDPAFNGLNLDDVEVLAVALLAFVLESQVSEASVPVLSVFGTNDELDGSDDPVIVYREALPPKHLVVVEGANHYGYTDGICVDVDNASQVGGAEGQEAHARQQRTARNYLHAFFSRYLDLPGRAGAIDYLIQEAGQSCGGVIDPSACGRPRRLFDDLQSLNVEVGVCSCE